MAKSFSDIGQWTERYDLERLRLGSQKLTTFRRATPLRLSPPKTRSSVATELGYFTIIGKGGIG